MLPSRNEDASQEGDNLEERIRGMILGNAGRSDKEESSSGRKRPNQAQRRQKNSQLSLPFSSPHALPISQAPGGVRADIPWQRRHYREPPQRNWTLPTQQHQLNALSFTSPYQADCPQPHQFVNGRSNQKPPITEPPFPEITQYPLQQASHQSYSQYPQDSQTRSRAQERYDSRRTLTNAQGRGPQLSKDEIRLQGVYIEMLVQQHIPLVEIEVPETIKKENFRLLLEHECRAAIARHEIEELGNQGFDPSTVELRCFGSMASGFATRSSDMDLALSTPKSERAPDSAGSTIPRMLEKILLELGYGARLLTRTRVPIIKLCEKPTARLQCDLLGERAKWERGSTAEQTHGGLNETTISSPTETDGAQLYERSGIAYEGSVQSRKNTTYEVSLKSLKQGSQQSHGDYHNAAKRLLRLLGGRDLTSSGPSLNREESMILNDVCKSFVEGLSSRTLSDRLQNYKSLSPLFHPSMPFTQRSLEGILHQIEGEYLAMAWDARPLPESNQRSECEGLEAIEAWRTLQEREGHLIETPLCKKQLCNASERLKRLRSLQLCLLKQNPLEDPIHYLRRTSKIVDELVIQDEHNLDTTTRIMTSCYISGILNEEIRTSLGRFTGSSQNLQRVGLTHCALQLAIDYEYSLRHGIYSPNDEKPVVKQYIEFLRFSAAKANPTFDGIGAALLAKIRSLPEPAKHSFHRSQDRYKDQLDFSTTDVGMQCDINFSADLAIHNTLLLRCYSLTDTRVKQMVLFIKHWAKSRAINTPYRGTLSSYGYVLMVLHYLVNVAQPFVCPNLQTINNNTPPQPSSLGQESHTFCKGRNVRFWRNEAEIMSLAQRKLLNHNHDSVGILLRGFFEYFAQTGPMSAVYSRGFNWGKDVLSLRTPGGTLTKQEKGWTGAKTVVETTTINALPTSVTGRNVANEGIREIQPICDSATKVPRSPNRVAEETREVRHRYLFAIEDPFELDHNVARTVTHSGIVSIRDEFRRAWRIIKGVASPDRGHEGGLLDLVTRVKDTTEFQSQLHLLHGVVE